jgi:hypothetical protein
VVAHEDVEAAVVGDGLFDERVGCAALLQVELDR